MGVMVGLMVQANSCRVSPGKKYSSTKATTRKGAITRDNTRVYASTRSSRASRLAGASVAIPNIVPLPGLSDRSRAGENRGDANSEGARHGDAQV